MKCIWRQLYKLENKYLERKQSTINLKNAYIHTYMFPFSFIHIFTIYKDERKEDQHCFYWFNELSSQINRSRAQVIYPNGHILYSIFDLK